METPLRLNAGRTREQRMQDLCFSSRHFVLCGLPVRRLPKDQLLYERRNGRVVRHITGHPEFGVPFGQDRLVPIFLATLSVQQKSQTIRFRTAADRFGTAGNTLISERCPGSSRPSSCSATSSTGTIGHHRATDATITREVR